MMKFLKWHKVKMIIIVIVATHKVKTIIIVIVATVQNNIVDSLK